MKRLIAAPFLFLFCIACEPAEADLESAAVEARQSELSIVLPDFCASSKPDSFVSLPVGIESVPSTGGAYFYKSGGCLRWVVDFKVVATGDILDLWSSAHDLPSSSAASQAMPANATDCGQYTRITTYYRKPAGGSAFISLGTAVVKGLWTEVPSGGGATAGKCFPAIVSGAEPSWPAPAIGDTYRVAVGVKLRGSWQEAAAYGSISWIK